MRNNVNQKVPGIVKDKQYNFNSNKSLYIQIKMLLTKNLINGEWRAGDLIPSEKDLAERYNVSQGTVRKAIETMSAENILIRRRGKGTLVAAHHFDGIKQRFLRLAPVASQSEALQSELVSCKKSTADAKMSHLLCLKKGEPTIEIKRLLTFSGRPLIYDFIVVPAKLFKGLNAKVLEDCKGALYGVYESRFGVNVKRAQEYIKAVAAKDECAKALGLNENDALLRVERISFTSDNLPVEWRLGLCVTDSHCYISELV